MHIASLFFTVLLIGIIPAVSKAQDTRHAAEIAANANEIYNDSSPSFGSPNPDVIIVEYYDYQCGYCKASEEGLERILQEYPNLKIIYKDFPKLGALSNTAAIATLASMRQGADKYLQLHYILMNKDNRLTGEEMLYQTANSVGIDVNRLKQDMNDPAITQQIENNIAVGKSAGVTVTPSFIIGGHFYPGAESYDQLKKIIDYERKADPGR